tara:strand:+ start:2854 stop:3228 length:375 start_codon:yes stop_codon:yes gene_type:complete
LTFRIDLLLLQYKINKQERDKMFNNLEKIKIANLEINVGDVLVLEGSKVVGSLYDDHAADRVDAKINKYKVRRILKNGNSYNLYEANKNSNPITLSEDENKIGGYRLNKKGNRVTFIIENVKVK